MRWWAALCLCTAAAKEGSLDKFQRRQEQHLRKHTPSPTRAPTPVGPTQVPTTRMPTDQGPTQVPTTKAPAAAPNTDINVVVACSKAHYTGALAVVASATNATRSQRHRLRFLLLVDDASKVESIALAPAVALPCSGKHAFHVKCLKEVVMRNPNPTCPNCRSPFVPTLLYATDGAARRGWHLASPSKQAVPTWVPVSPRDASPESDVERLAAEYRAARPESPPLGPLDLAASPLLRALADADRFGGRVVGEEFEAAARENISVCAGSFLV